MGRPQDNRLQRSGNTPLDPDHIETEVQTRPDLPRDEPGAGPVPPANRPGHHSGTDQDQPDLDQFAERFGIAPDDADTADEDTSSRDRISMLTDGARSLIGFAQDVVAPVADRVQAKVRQTIDDRRSLIDRVDALESQVAALTERLDAR